MSDPHAPLPVSIPAETTTLGLMKRARRWLLYKIVPKFEPDKKPDKVPYYANGRPRSGALDSPEDLAQLVTYDEAMAAFNSAPQGMYAGLGFALGPDENGGCWQGIDLDDVEANKLRDLVETFTIGTFRDWGYVELSPSEKGMHIIGYGPPFPCNLGPNSTGIEAYSSRRYFTFTGRKILPQGGVKHGRPCDLSLYVEQKLRPIHSAGKTANPDDSYAGRAEIEIDDETYADLRSAIIFWDPNNRGEWVDAGHALKDLGRRGLDIWITWSQLSITGPDPKDTKYNWNDAMRVWDSIKPDGRTNYKNIFKVAQDRGWLNPQSAASLRRRFCKCGATVVLPPLRYNFRTGEVTPGKLGGFGKLPDNLWPQS